MIRYRRVMRKNKSCKCRVSVDLYIKSCIKLDPSFLSLYIHTAAILLSQYIKLTVQYSNPPPSSLVVVLVSCFLLSSPPSSQLYLQSLYLQVQEKEPERWEWKSWKWIWTSCLYRYILDVCLTTYFRCLLGCHWVRRYRRWYTLSTWRSFRYFTSIS